VVHIFRGSDDNVRYKFKNSSGIKGEFIIISESSGAYTRISLRELSRTDSSLRDSSREHTTNMFTNPLGNLLSRHTLYSYLV
jgi:hypothetical protein